MYWNIAHPTTHQHGVEFPNSRCSCSSNCVHWFVHHQNHTHRAQSCSFSRWHSQCLREYLHWDEMYQACLYIMCILLLNADVYYKLNSPNPCKHVLIKLKRFSSDFTISDVLSQVDMKRKIIICTVHRWENSVHCNTMIGNYGYDENQHEKQQYVLRSQRESDHRNTMTGN